MKFRTKWEVIVLNEIKTQWRIFIVFFLIILVLLTASISINTLTFQLPKDLESYVTDYGLNSIGIYNLDSDKFQKVDEIPAEVISVYAKIDGSVIGIDTENTYEYKDFILSTDGTAEKWFADKGNEELDYLNNHLLEGKGFYSEDNDRLSIWISDFFMDELNLKCGDWINISNSNGDMIECLIEGIYNQDDFSVPFITTFAVYGFLSENNTYDISVQLRVSQLKNYYYVIRALEDSYISYYSEKDEVESLLLLIYALIVIDVIVLILTVSFSCSIFKLYHLYRDEFYVILKTQGMSNINIFKIIVMLMEGIYFMAFISAIFIAPFLNNYIADCITDIFDDLVVNLNFFDKNCLWILAGNTILVFLTCCVQQKIFFGTGMNEKLSKGNE